MDDRLKVFISSRAKDNAHWRETAADVLEKAGHDPIRLPEGGSRDRHIREYLKQLGSSEIVLYLVDEHSDAVEEEISTALRLGKPIIMLTPSKRIAGDRILTDFAKKTRDDSRTMVYTFDDLANLRNLVQTSVETVIARRFHEPRKPITWGGDIYRRLADSMGEVDSRFAFAQETSSLILGPSLSRTADEERFLDAFYEMVARLRTNPSLHVVHVFDVEATAHALRTEAADYPENAQWSTKLLEAIAADTTGRLEVKGVPPRLSPIMVADDSMLLGHHIGPRSRRGSFHQEVGEWATDTWGHVRAAIRAEGRDVAGFLKDVAASA